MVNIPLLGTNIGSLSAKFDLLLAHVSTTNPSCILISETWLNTSITDIVVCIPGYTLYRAYHTNKWGGNGFLSRVGADFSQATKQPVAYHKNPTGPILFLVYTADLIRTIHSHASVYANNNNIFENPITQSASMQIIHFGKTNPGVDYFLNGFKLTVVETQPDLGVTVTDNLRWSTHISSIVKKPNNRLYTMKRTLKNLSTQVPSKLYTTYIRPLLELASPTWYPWLVRDEAAFRKSPTQRDSVSSTEGPAL
ncbi:hypothetical protein JTB14_007083 [Gonioctena quinquepunctata]|nr:hypothetical protein JTB14_007083 [Gonioctena quinquepunctata]